MVAAMVMIQVAEREGASDGAPSSPRGECNACFLYQHLVCEFPLSCSCTFCHPGRAKS